MNLAQRSVRSSAFNISSSILQTVIAFIRSIILLRLLTPEVFGTYRFLGSFVFWTAALPLFGLGGALIHRADESEGENALRTHFTITLFLNLIWATGLGIFGYFSIQSANNFGAFLIILISQFLVNITHTAKSKLVRKVEFRRIAFLNSLSSILSALVVVFLAWKGYGLWSLVSTDLIQACIIITGFFIIRPVWRPKLGFFEDSAKYFLDFGKRNFLNLPLLRTLDRLDDLWVGMFLGNQSLGFYSRAYRLASYPGNLLASPLGSVASGTYAELKNSPKKLSQAFFRVNAFLVRTSFLIGGLLTLIAPEFILIIAGEQWLPMVNTFRLMLVFTLLNPLKITIAGLFIGIGKPEIVSRIRIIQLVVLIVFLFIFGYPFGIDGVAIAIDLMLIVGIVYMINKTKFFVKISFKTLFIPPTIALITGFTIGLLVLISPLKYGSTWMFLIIKTFSFAIPYIITLILIERDRIIRIFRYLLQLAYSYKT